MRILFRGREYHIEEEEVAGNRRVTIFVRSSGQTVAEQWSVAPGEGGAPGLAQGPWWTEGLGLENVEDEEWEPALEYAGSEERIVPGTSVRDPTALKCVLRAFLTNGAPVPRPGVRRYWGLATGDLPAYSLGPLHLDGLAVRVYSSAEKAQDGRSAVDDRLSPRVEEIVDLEAFLAARAREGFAGALLDDEEPIYFLLDDEGRLRVLKLASDGTDVEPMLLDRKGGWFPFEGEIEMRPFQDQEDCDQLMVRYLGSQPYLGFVPEQKFWSPSAASGEDGVGWVEVEDEWGVSPIVPLFADPLTGRAYLDRHGFPGREMIEVADLRDLVRRAQDASHPVVLHPEEHRAYRANLWVNGEDLILDTYSGFWRRGSGTQFAPIA
ncbi:MAG: hypothetical protein HY720_11920 [Planctomycetes bacterium]|nr:hypothetical protein [Planctomycetota bacterium]